jgi:hypothetical protein
VSKTTTSGLGLSWLGGPIIFGLWLWWYAGLGEDCQTACREAGYDWGSYETSCGEGACRCSTLTVTP